MRLAVVTLLVTTGCAPLAKPPAAAPAACDAAGVQSLIGRTMDEALAREAQARSGARTLRRIGPDDMVTMDHRPDRLNLEVDAQGRLRVARCG